MLGLAGAWVLIEWTRTWLFGGFPWMPLAATQWESMRAVLQIAAYTGAAGVSFVLVAANVGIAAFSNRLFREGETGLRRRSPELLLALFLLLVCLSVHVQETTNQRQFAVPFARVAFVQPDIPPLVKWDPSKETEIMRALWATTLAAAPLNPDLVLLARVDDPVPAQPGPLDEALRRAALVPPEGPHAGRGRRRRARGSHPREGLQRRVCRRPPARAPDGVLREAAPRPVRGIHPAAPALRVGGKVRAARRRFRGGDGLFAPGRAAAPGIRRLRRPHLP